VWVTCSTPLDAVLVRSIARAAAARLPTLDHGMLCNPAAGAPHRSGGRGELGQGLGSVGRHLKILLDARLIRRRRDGRSVLYDRTPAGEVLVGAQAR
jgi:DNA-binding transcriptional ArsR family regulator